jgi:Rrf2 family iron-sulfur cluster assembly transcriptional regulator
VTDRRRLRSYIAVRGGGPVPVREIASAGAIPEPYLAKILHRLSGIGYVVTQRGIGGGVSLAIDPRQVTLYHLCEVLLDPVVRPQCLLGGSECNDDKACPAHEFQRSIRKRQLAFLSATTVDAIGRHDAKKRSKSESRSRKKPRATPSRAKGAKPSSS